jgi:hypothetical protein
VIPPADCSCSVSRCRLSILTAKFKRGNLGHICKQGNVLLRFLLVEAALVTVRSQQEWRNKFFHLAMRREEKIAKVATARKLAVLLYWMWRQGRDYGQWRKFGSQAPRHHGLTDGGQYFTDE